VVSYDPNVITMFAQRLYARAAIVIALHTVIGVVLGGVAGKFAYGTGSMLILAAVGGVLGFLLGSQRAFLLKLQAQTALCQIQIEQNTRGGAMRSPEQASETTATQGAVAAESAEASRRAAENLAASGNTVAQISKELQKWRGLSAAEADELARSVKARS
jgi:hypothetical protein